ncbi:hypothetical protein LJ707_03040 [Mucilaginibacter sp. UR6-1]|uniref:hypothetical protein n=1 Tax=Mucilaginibacter sp. UR6-1 TaxID=1435643 RepID=UPI001E47978D|nr:hypothetical protein [Mucilaginibacter sp. UR6-1]MCC8407888.1 hypothetical protein [Mucilaginibacter sp. UR6-1]
MGSRSAKPVKDEKGFFGKVKETIEDILTGPQGDLVSNQPDQAKKATAKKTGRVVTNKVPPAKTTVKRKAKKATAEAKTLKGRAEKQVIAAKAKAVNNINIEPVKASKLDK